MSIKVCSCTSVIMLAVVLAACGSRPEPARPAGAAAPPATATPAGATPAPAASGAGTPSSPEAGGDAGRRLTHDECAAAVDHAIALFEAGADTAAVAAQLRAERASSIAQCEATATLRDHRCLMKATTASELGLCPMPGAQ
jgi:hypothetical protein